MSGGQERKEILYIKLWEQEIVFCCPLFNTGARWRICLLVGDDISVFFLRLSFFLLLPLLRFCCPLSIHPPCSIHK